MQNKKTNAIFVNLYICLYYYYSSIIKKNKGVTPKKSFILKRSAKMRVIKSNVNALEIIENFNRNNNIKDVIETITGRSIKGKSLCCPLHNGDNKNGSSVHLGQNIFTCWTKDCTNKKGISPWTFIKKYYGLNSFKEVAKKVNELFNANIPIYEQQEEKNIEEVGAYDNVINVEKYLSEAKDIILNDLREYRHLLINGNTGLGKTYCITELAEELKEVDYIFFLVPTRSIAEQVAKEYPAFKIFYGNDTSLPNSRFIVSTYHKIHMLEEAIESEIKIRAEQGEFPPMYAVVVDEVHELMAKRKLLKEKSRMVEAFIKNSDYSILMSANTEYIYKTHKDNNLFNRYLNIKTIDKHYNANNLCIYRLPKEQNQKKAIVIKTIIDKLSKYSNVLFQEDCISKLEEYRQELISKNIECILINSENRDEEEVLKEYKAIINDSKLNKAVILVTSIINAGVNIKQDNIALIIKQDRMQFDIQKIHQFLSRVRTENNDLTVLLGSTNKKVGNISQLDYFINKYDKLSSIKTLDFNNYYFNKFGLDMAKESIYSDWEAYKNNETYREVKDMLYTDNGILKADYPAVIEKARLEYERDNYYNNDFIVNSLKDVKARFINDIITIAPLKLVKESKIKQESTIKEDLQIILKNSKALIELLELVKKQKSSKELEQEVLQDFYDKYKQNTLFKELLSILRVSLKLPSNAEGISEATIFINILEEYTKDKSKKDRLVEIDNIRRVEVYNKILPLGASLEDIKITGDIVYYAVRKNFDCYIVNRLIIKNRAYDWAFEDIYKLRDYKDSVDKKNNPIIIDSKGKKVNIADVQQEIESCVNSIYNMTTKGYITDLL